MMKFFVFVITLLVDSTLLVNALKTSATRDADETMEAVLSKKV
jgi:hypothetical protein